MPSTPAMSSADTPLLALRGLTLSTVDGQRLVDDLSLTLLPGQWLALVGESGSGKSLSALACLRLLPAGLRQAGQVLWQGRDLATCTEPALRQLRGGGIGMIYQEPLTALNPLQRIGKQLLEAIRLHQPGLTAALARQRMLQLLTEVGIDQPAQRLRAWPHELSGGQRQRVLIAMALANKPKLLIADEPTTALDAVLQTQILDLLKTLQRRHGMAILLISHDLRQVQRYADRIIVMQRGVTVEHGDAAEVFAHPASDYTRQLLTPLSTTPPPALPAEAPLLLSVSQLDVRYVARQHWWGGVAEWHTAVSQIGLGLRRGESLAIVGESGSGKSSLAGALLRLIPAAGGRVLLNGRDWLTLTGEPLRLARREAQIMLQDPYGSLSPRMTVGDLIAEGLRAHPREGEDIDARVSETLAAVQLTPDVRDRYPHEFSGGQRQRIALARALILRPALLVLDEPTSALDRHTQREIVALLADIQRRTGISYLFITHDLSLVRALCHRTLVMRGGRLIEQGETETLFARPRHGYTRTLLQAAGI